MNCISCFDPPFEVIARARAAYPVIFNSPHSGCQYPDSFVAGSRLDTLTLRRSEDCYVDELFARAGALGCPLLKVNFPRAYLDVNREAYELDPDMFSDPLPHYVNTASPRVAGGLGTIARIVCERHEIYRHKLSWHDAEARINRLYRPYHRTLASLISAAQARFGWAVVIDCHSMPSGPAATRNGQPDIVLGDRYGASCTPAMTDLLESLFTRAGLRVVRNKPYAGGYITQTYGRPRQRIHGLQIEIDRSLYMDERSLSKSGGFSALRNLIGTVMSDFVATVPDILYPVRRAAE